MEQTQVFCFLKIENKNKNIFNAVSSWKNLRLILGGCTGISFAVSLYNHCSKKTVNHGSQMTQGILVCNFLPNAFFKKKNLSAAYKDFRALLTILATNTNNLDNHNLFFLSIFTRRSKQSSIIGPRMKYKFSAMEMKTKAICTFSIPRGIILGLFTMKYSLYLILF